MIDKNTIIDGFKSRYNSAATVLSSAPGRLEILGNHTDYNEGFVISAAVDLGTTVALAKRDDRMVNIHNPSLDLTAEFSLDAIGDAIPGDWCNYVKGVIVEMQKRAFEFAGFDAFFDGDVPLSAGMSSSAALEISFALGIGKLYGIELENSEWARIGQGSEANYIGVNTGLLDQFTSLMGKKNAFVKTDFRSLEVETIDAPDSAVFVVTNSHVKHDLTEEYNERHERCIDAAKVLNVPFLRDADQQQLDDAKASMHILSYRRACHILGENDRVHAAEEALKQNDLTSFGRLLNASHESSKNNFENSCPELDILVDAGKALDGFYGARLSGGGFGGISIHLVDKEKAGDYKDNLESYIKAHTGEIPQVMICAIGDGATVEEL
ncbi:MAG: galactokinase [Lentisphaeria bacterium]|nr:galactokinase [Lentisphaeria bacterium]